MTSRGFLAHPIQKCFFKKMFPPRENLHGRDQPSGIRWIYEKRRRKQLRARVQSSWQPSFRALHAASVLRPTGPLAACRLQGRLLTRAAVPCGHSCSPWFPLSGVAFAAFGWVSGCGFSLQAPVSLDAGPNAPETPAAFCQRVWMGSVDGWPMAIIAQPKTRG